MTCFRKAQKVFSFKRKYTFSSLSLFSMSLPLGSRLRLEGVSASGIGGRAVKVEVEKVLRAWIGSVPSWFSRIRLPCVRVNGSRVPTKDKRCQVVTELRDPFMCGVFEYFFGTVPTTGCTLRLGDEAVTRVWSLPA